jgi:hypothetical protein
MPPGLAIETKGAMGMDEQGVSCTSIMGRGS